MMMPSERIAEPATDKQIAYARDLGATFSADITKREISDLIDATLDRDKPPSSSHRAFASALGVEFTPYVGKRALFDAIASTLKSRNDHDSLLRWFIWRVYRTLVHGASNTAITDPNDARIAAIAAVLAKDARIIASVRKYDGAALIWFGDLHGHRGGSANTIAYKAASGALRAQADIADEIRRFAAAHATGTKHSDAPTPSVPRRSSHVGIVAIILLALAALAAMYLLK